MKFCECLVCDPDTDETEPCGLPVEGNTTMCASHNAFYRKLEKQNLKQSEKREQQLNKAKEKRLIIKADITKPIYKLAKAQKAIRKVSKKREELNKEYFKLVEQFKKDNPKCKANVNEYCTKNTDDPHHSRGRGEYLLAVSTWVPVCRSCHSYIEAHPKEAKERGWSESRLAKPKETI